MEKIKYTDEKMNMIKQQVQRLVEIVAQLEAEFPGRHFTLDGHLVGSIGEVMAAYYYGIELYAASTEIHDGEVDGKKSIDIDKIQKSDIVGIRKNTFGCEVMVSDRTKYEEMEFVVDKTNLEEIILFKVRGQK